MSLPLVIFDEEADCRRHRLSILSSIVSLDIHDAPVELGQECHSLRSPSRGRSRTRRVLPLPPPPPPIVEAPPIPPKSTARHLNSIREVARSVSSIYTDTSQRRKYLIEQRTSPDWDEKELIEVHDARDDIEHDGRLSDPRPAPLPPWHPSNNPDGGLQAWLSVAGSWCGLFVSFGWISSMGVFQAHYQTHQLHHSSSSAISWISSLETFLLFAGGPVVGRIFDNYGTQPLLILGSFIHVLGLMLASISSQYYQLLLAQGILASLGASMVFHLSIANVATWFTKRRALAFCILASGSSVGGVVLPIMFEQLLPLVGFDWSVRGLALLILALCIIANVTVTSRNKPVRRPVAFREYIVPLRNVSFALTSAGCIFFVAGLFLPLNFIVLQAEASGMATRLAVYMPAVMNGLSLVGYIGPTWVASHLGRCNVLIVMALFCTVINLALWIPAHSNALIILYSALYGLGSGAFISMGPSLIAQIAPGVGKVGVWTGTYYALVSSAALIGNPLGGLIVEKWHGEFLGLQIFTGCLHFAAALFLLFARVSLSGVAWDAKV